GADGIAFAGHAGAEPDRRDRRGPDPGAAGRRRAGVPAGTAALYTRADLWGGRGGSKRRRAGRRRAHVAPWRLSAGCAGAGPMDDGRVPAHIHGIASAIQGLAIPETKRERKAKKGI